jgi:hypothetical protein
MGIQSYLDAIEQSRRLSAVKLLIIKELWGSGKFPGSWVKSSRLLTLTNQKYFDRRIRELRDENGLDLDTAVIDGEHCYRILSRNIGKKNIRAYLSAADKTKLFKSQDYKCQVCGKHAEAGARGLQADHKKPLGRGGTNKSDNWQSICNECNVAKRRSCQGCTEDCAQCFWAFPNSNLLPLTIRLPKDVFDIVNKKILEQDKWLVEILKKHLD